jgi:AcrR family transcriptional regulator
MPKKLQKNNAKWKQDPDAVKADILRVATQVFNEFGFAGARVDEIVHRTKTSKRMIYYYYGDKKGLYISVLEAAYERLREKESALQLPDDDPAAALRRWVEFTFDYHRHNPDYVRLIAIENIHGAKHLKSSSSVQAANMPAVQTLRRIYDAGVEVGVFRSGIDPVELHWLITSSCVFNVTNRSSFKYLHGSQIFEEQGQLRLKTLLLDAITSAVQNLRSS